MRRRPLSWQKRLGIGLRLLVVLSPVILLASGILALFNAWCSQETLQAHCFPLSTTNNGLMDPKHLLSQEGQEAVKSELSRLNAHMQTQWVLVLVPHLENPGQGNPLAQQLFDRWKLADQGHLNRSGVIILSQNPFTLSWYANPTLNNPATGWEDLWETTSLRPSLQTNRPFKDQVAQTLHTLTETLQIARAQ